MEVRKRPEVWCPSSREANVNKADPDHIRATLDYQEFIIDIALRGPVACNGVHVLPLFSRRYRLSACSRITLMKRARMPVACRKIPSLCGKMKHYARYVYRAEVTGAFRHSSKGEINIHESLERTALKPVVVNRPQIYVHVIYKPLSAFTYLREHRGMHDRSGRKVRHAERNQF